MVEVMWWLTVAAYLGTAVLCAVCALQQKSNKGQRNTWWGLAGSMVVLGINKQQNLTGILTSLGRQNAFQENWYSSRSGLQLILVAAFWVIGLVLLVLLIRYRHAISRLQGTAVIGVIFLFSFALVRAVSLHAIDVFLYRRITGIQPNWLVELGGIALVAVPAVVALTRKEKEEIED
jgi:hypothetical protein